MENLWIKIEAYLAGKLNSQEQQVFEEELKTNETLAAELELFKDIEGGIRLKGNEALRSQLDKIHDQVIIDNNPQRTTKRISLSWFRAGAIAASVVFIIALAYLLLRPVAPENLYAQHTTAFIWGNTTRSETVDELQTLRELYRSADYARFIRQADLQNRKIDQHPSLFMALAYALQTTEDYAKALEYYELLENNPLFNNEAKWNKALVYLKLDRIPEAQQELNDLAQGKHKFAEKAQSLLLELGSTFSIEINKE